MENKKKLIVIDGNSLLFRAYFATAFGGPQSIMRSSDGTPTNAIFAFSNMITKIISSFTGGESLFVGFDADSHTFRKAEFDAYKANRAPCPEELKPQFPMSREFLDAMGILHYEESGIEADDICGTVAKLGSAAGYEVTIYTSDKDYLQLVDDNITVKLTKKGLSVLQDVTPLSMPIDFGFSPKQIIDFKGLRGDSSDNLPGIPGIGDKTAVKLINEYGSFEQIVAAAKDGRIKGKVGQNIIDNEELGRTCYRLATIMIDAKLPFGLQDTLYKGYDFASISEFAKKYELKQFIQRLPPNLKKGGDGPRRPALKKVTSLAGIAFASKVGLAVDVDEATYHDVAPSGLAVADQNGIYYIDIESAKKDEATKRLLADPNIKKDVYDAKLCLLSLAGEGLKLEGISFDLVLAAYILDSSLTASARVIFSSFGVDVAPSKEVVEDLGLFSEGEIELTGNIAYYSLALEEKAMSSLKEIAAEKLYSEIEFPLAFVLAKMEKEGFPLNRGELEKIGETFKAKRDQAQAKVYELAGHPFNIASPKQVATVLYEELKLGGGKDKVTSVDVLKELEKENPIVTYILSFRKYAKLCGTYIDGLIPHIKSDGKIHTIFNQAQTTTGRLSSSNPNLQNISARDEDAKEIRKAFHYEDGDTKILSLDYSQIELRVLASLSNCQSYIDVFNNGHDVHSETARKIFNIAPNEEVPPLLRRRAKAVNFAIIYGTSPFGLAEQIDGTPYEASAIIRNFYSAYPEIGEYLQSITDTVTRQGYVTTLFGRRRYLHEINDPVYAKREAARRAALNAPVQGTAADLIKVAMLKVDEFLSKGNYKTKMVLQIHDELLFAVPSSEVEVMLPKLKEIMENAISLKVKLSAEGAYGDTWYNAKD